MEAQLATNLLAALLFAVLGIVILVLSFVLLDRLRRTTSGARSSRSRTSRWRSSAAWPSSGSRSSSPRPSTRAPAPSTTVAAGLLAAVLLIAACGLVYELVAGAIASYLLGDSVTQFSTVIGTYLFAMGIGSWLSRFVVRNVAARFVGIELLVGAVGGFSSTLLFLAFGYTDGFRVALYALVLVIGTLVGLEIPLLMRILRDQFDFKDTVANVLTFDYLGALGASLLFPSSSCRTWA